MTNLYLTEAKHYRMIFDYHTHTIFSHGKGTIEDNVKTAVEKGLEGIAITDHGPGHLTYGIKRQAVGEMRSQVELLKKEYPQISIFLGVEANIIHTGNCLDVTKEEFPQYDFVIGGYHYGVFNGYCVDNWLTDHIRRKDKSNRDLLVKNTDMVVKALHENNLKIISHPGDKGPFDIVEIAKACKDTGTLMEINTRHRHLTVEELRQVKNSGAQFVVSSDAHTADRVGDYLEGVARMLEAGVDPETAVNIKKQ